MHDIHLADKIMEICQKQAKGKKVKKVAIKLGKIIEHEEEIKPENLKYNLKLLSKNTNFQNTEFEIKIIKGNKYKIDYIEV